MHGVGGWGGGLRNVQRPSTWAHSATKTTSYEDFNKKYTILKCNIFSLSSGTCCSRRGWCSHSPDECLCDECTYYEWDDGEHRLNIELDLQALFGLLCTAELIG
jgi:hypothetical protein